MQIWTIGRRMGTTYEAVEAAICIFYHVRHTLHLVHLAGIYHGLNCIGHVIYPPKTST